MSPNIAIVVQNEFTESRILKFLQLNEQQSKLPQIKCHKVMILFEIDYGRVQRVFWCQITVFDEEKVSSD
jgi:hypothetical protein